MSIPNTRYGREYLKGADGNEVLLARGILCLHCASVLRASDVIIDRDEIKLVCDGCHKDLLRVRGAG